MSTTTATLRPVTDDDDLDAINAGNPVWSGSALVRRLIGGPDRGARVWLVAEVDDEPAGYAHATFAATDAENKVARAQIWVKPGFRRRGVGRQLWDAIVEPLERAGAERISAYADGGDPASLDWVRGIGAQLGNERIQSTLDLSALETETGDIPEGLTISALPPEADEEDWHGFYLAYVRASGDTPDGLAGRPPIPEQVLRASLPEHWQVCVARDSELRIVGITCVFVRNADSREVNTLITGVERDWRGKGLSTALKREHGRLLALAGWRTLVTQNMVGNEPILAANRRLGFRAATTLIDTVATLKS